MSNSTKHFFVNLIILFSFFITSVLMIVVGGIYSVFADDVTYTSPGSQPVNTDRYGNADALYISNLSSNNITVEASGLNAAYGGYSNETSTAVKTVDNNVLTITNGATVTVLAIGGHVYITASPGGNNATVTGNKTYVENSSTVGKLVAGGYATLDCGSSPLDCGEAIANKNQLYVTDSTIGTDSTAYGGYIKIEGKASTQIKENFVIFTNASIDGGVYGGFSEIEYGNVIAEGNELKFVSSTNTGSDSGTIVGENLYTAYVHIIEDGNITINNNILKVEQNSTINLSVYAADTLLEGSGNIEASSNIIYIINSTVSDAVQAALANINEDGAANANDNQVILENATVGGSLTVGEATVDEDGNVEALRNIITSSGTNTVIYYTLAGAASVGGLGNATAEGNKIILVDSSIEDSLDSGIAEVGKGIAKANYNVVSLTKVKSNNSGEIHVAMASSIGSGSEVVTTGNVAELTDTNVDAFVYVATNILVADGKVTSESNTITLTESHVTSGEIYGSYTMTFGASSDVTVNNNHVYLTDSSSDGDVYTAYILAYESSIFESNENTIVATNSALSANVYASYSTVEKNGEGVAKDNQVRFTSTTASSDVYGAYISFGKDDSIATASENLITLFNSSIGNDAIVGYTQIRAAGGSPSTADSNGNTLIMDNSSIDGNAIGGKALVEGDGSALADDNTMILSDAEIHGDVIGGYASVPGAITKISATGSSITLSGNTALYGTYSSCSPSCRLAGGYTDVPLASGVDVFKGNTLNVTMPGTSGIAVGVRSVENFQYYNFTFPAGVTTGAVALKFTGAGAVVLSDGKTIPSVIQSVDIEVGGAFPGVGTRLVLVDGNIQTSDGSGTEIFTQETASGNMGMYVAIEYDLEYLSDGGSLVAVIRSATVAENSKSLSEAFLSAAILVNQGADLAAQKGMNNAVMAAYESVGWNIFSAIAFSHLRHETGSHVDASSYSLQVGVSKGFDIAGSRLTVGVFVEGGRGSYDTYNHYPGVGDIRGKGKGEYLGAGILARLELARSDIGNPYFEASVRMGRAKNDFSSEDMPANINSYDIGSNYYGFHVGVGYDFRLGEWGRLDLGARYFQNHRDGIDTFAPSGAPVSFHAVDSKRLRLGARLFFLANDMFNPYIGAAWEKEFDGESSGSVFNQAIPEVPSLKGNTGIGELGVSVRFSSSVPIILDLGVQGYTGKRRGFGGGVTLSVEF